jgi:D-serine deaminase-like pyridoxal phosphate-dependent protein
MAGGKASSRHLKNRLTTMTHKLELDTPCLLLELDILEQNIRKMQATAGRAGKALRPHAKTHKCSSLARMQLQAGAQGVCAAKLSEAAALVDAGLDDILITGPVATPFKVDRLIELAGRCGSLKVVLDHAGNADLLDRKLADRGLAMDVYLDIDVGLHRTGVKPSGAVALAEKIVACPSLKLVGVQAYAGHVQHIQSFDERRYNSLHCLEDAVAAFREIRERVPGCRTLSTSGTGTFDIDLEIAEVTELQVGSYVLMDTEYLDIGSAEDTTRFAAFEPALRLLTSVISANHESHVTVDAGLKSLYRDGGIPRVAGPAPSTLKYDWYGDEYGMITSAGEPLPAAGAVLELLVSHCDPTVNQFDVYHLVRGNEVVGKWPIDLRGCSQ